MYFSLLEMLEMILIKLQAISHKQPTISSKHRMNPMKLLSFSSKASL